MKRGGFFCSLFVWVLANVFVSLSWLIHKIYFCILFNRLVAKQDDFFLHIKANLSDKYLDMSDIIATFVA